MLFACSALRALQEEKLGELEPCLSAYLLICLSEIDHYKPEQAHLPLPRFIILSIRLIAVMVTFNVSAVESENIQLPTY